MTSRYAPISRSVRIYFDLRALSSGGLKQVVLLTLTAIIVDFALVHDCICVCSYHMLIVSYVEDIDADREDALPR